MNTTNLYSNNPTVERHVGRLLPIAELLRDPQATLSEVRRTQEVSRRRLAAQQAELATKQLELLVEQIACALRVEVERLRSRDRQQHLSFQRQVAMYLPKRISQASFPALAPAFNRRHSTLIAACQVVEAACPVMLLSAGSSRNWSARSSGQFRQPRRRPREVRHDEASKSQLPSLWQARAAQRGPYSRVQIHGFPDVALALPIGAARRARARHGRRVSRRTEGRGVNDVAARKKPVDLDADILTIYDIAAYLRCSVSTVYRLTRTGSLRGAFTIGRDYRFNKSQFEQWVKEQTRTSKSAVYPPRVKR